MAKRCENPDCTNEIPAERLRHNPRQKYCCYECAAASIAAQRRDTDFYQRLSAQGNAAQQAFKARTGHVPGYEQRKAALQRPDRPNRRKRRSEQGKNRD